ncbi:hypothetical protein MTE01_28740 [Microbacterium testaceum]|uniref:Uncharacterized protein n=1 Tax=Microbacterium testaceum TaxID=2033 RepID=A0A4Y3QPV4_MICTE|nr:hypothetical protein [Microbacterium testaceum]GEB46929.1 hypothetical protein MTE01_28740 [Microbacterium testaceum]
MPDVTVGHVIGRFLDKYDSPIRGEVRFSRVIASTQGAPAFRAPITRQDVALVDGKVTATLALGVYDVAFSFVRASHPSFRIEVTSAHTTDAPLDLVVEAPIEEKPGEVFIVNERVWREATEAAARSVRAATDAGLAAADARAYQASAWNARNEASTAAQLATGARDSVRADADRASQAAAEVAAIAGELHDATFRISLHPTNPGLAVVDFADFLRDPVIPFAIRIPLGGAA